MALTKKQITAVQDVLTYSETYKDLAQVIQLVSNQFDEIHNQTGSMEDFEVADQLDRIAKHVAKM